MEKSNDQSDHSSASKPKGHKTAKTDMSGSSDVPANKKISTEELKARRQTDLSAVHQKKEPKVERISLRPEDLKKQKDRSLSPRTVDTDNKRKRFSVSREKDPVLFTHKRTASDEGRAGTLENVSPRYRKLAINIPTTQNNSVNKSPKKSARYPAGWRRVFEGGQIPSMIEEHNTLTGAFAALVAHFCIPNFENRIELTPRSSTPSVDPEGEYTSEDVPADWEYDKIKQDAAYRSFWFDNKAIARSSSSIKVDDPQFQEIASREKTPLIKALMSFVPKIVVRRFINEPHRPIRAPETESYLSCVLFADISGFTPLAESLTTLDAEGVEKVTLLLNNYFGSLINMIHDHGGDIVKFAGDALMAIWPTDDEKVLPLMSLLGCQCGVEMLTKMGDYDTGIGDYKLNLHIGIGAGKIAGMHVGGTQGRLEFLIAGDPIDQVSSCEAQAKPGEIFISPQCYKYMKQHFVGEGPFVSKNYRLDNIINPASLPEKKDFPLLAIFETRLKSYVPPAVLVHLESVRMANVDYLAELRTVTVLFVNIDVKYEAQDDVATAKTLQFAVVGMQAVLSKFEGTVRQFIIDDKGGVLIAAFGLPPMSHEDDPQRAVEAAMEIKKILETLKIKCSIGVTTGRAFCGAVGSETRREYAMVGDIVNLSARLMVKAKDLGGILCDEVTYLAANKHVEFKSLTPITVKGKKHPIKVFFPHHVLAIAKLNLNRLSNRNRSEEEEAKEACLGRAKALALVEHKIKQLKSKNQPGNVLVLEGEAGMGKTRIVGQMKFMIDEEAEIFYGTTDGITMGQSYGSWAEIFNAVLDLGSVEDPSQLLSHIRKQLRRIPPNLSLPDMVPGWTKLAPLLKSILPLEIPENELTATMTDQSRAENLQLLLIRLLQTSVMPGSVIVLDDAHLFDTASWALTLAVSQQLKGVLVVVCLRPLKPPFPFEYQQITHCENAHQINLTPLTPEDSVILAKQFLGVDKIPPQIATQIQEKGQGIPYLIEELSQSLKDSGVITIENGECKVKPGKELVLPSTIRQLITSKVDKLAATQRALLKVASVIGKNFDAVLLTELYPEGVPTLQDDLDALETAGFICKEVEQTTGPKTKLTMRGFNSARDLDSGVISGHTPRTPSGDISIALRRPSAGLNASPRSLSPGKSSILADRAQAEQGPSSALPAITTSPPVQKANPTQPGSPENGTSVNSTSPKPKSGKQSPRPKRTKGELDASGGDKEKLNLETSSGSAKARNRRKNRNKVTRASSERVPGTKNINDVTDKHEEMTRSTPEIPEYVTPRELERSPSGRKYRTLSRTLTRTLRFNQAGPAADETAKNREFSFKNQTVHEVVYQLMLFSQRRQLHKKVAEWYEQNHADNLSSFSGLLAHHWKLSDANPNKAKNYYVQAGDQCLRIFSNREAVNFFLEALTLEKRAKKRDSTGKQESTSGFGFLAGNLAKTGKTILNLVNGAKLDVKERTDDPEMMANSIRLRRKLGQAYYSMGLFSKSTMYLKRALKMARLNLNYSDVSSNSRHMATTYQHILKAHPLIQRETVLSLLSLAKVHYYSCNRTFSTYCNELALVVAEKANFWAEQCEAYSQCILTAGLTNQHSLASVYMEMGSKLAQEKLDLVSNLLQMSGVYYCGRASWSKTEKCFEEAAASCQRTGDRRRYEECNIFLAMSLYLQGQIKRSLQFSKTALDSARLRGDIQCQILALSSQTCCHITLGNIIKASAKLDQIRLALGKDDTNAVDKAVAGGDISSSLNYNALMALMCLQKGEPGNAWEFARMADQILSSKNVEPTAFFTFPGYMGLPEIYLRLLLQPKCWGDLHLTQQKLIRRINNSLKALEEFCKVFPFAYPRMYLLQGLFLLAAGADMSKVIIAWKSGLRQAIKYHMTYEREIIRAHLNLDKDNSLQSYRLASSASLSSPLFDRSGELKVLHRENSSGPESTNVGESGPSSKGVPELTPRRIAAEAMKRGDNPNRDRLGESDYDISSASDEELKENTVDEIIAEVRRTTKKLDDMKEEEEESSSSEEERQFREVVSDPEDTYDSDDDVLDSARKRPTASNLNNTNVTAEVKINNNANINNTTTAATETEVKKVVDESKVNKEKNKNNKPAGTSGAEAANNEKSSTKAKVPPLQLSTEAKDRTGKERLLQMSANGSNNNMSKLKYKRVKHMSSDSYRKGLPAFEKELKAKEKHAKKKDKSPRVTSETIAEENNNGNNKPTSPRSDPASPKSRTVDPKNVRERNKNNKKTKDKPTIVVVSSPRASNNANNVPVPNGSSSPRSADPLPKKTSATPNGSPVKEKSKHDSKKDKRNSEPKAKRKTKS